MASFETILPRLVAAYESGRLVPFIGSGMSIPACVDWRTLVQRLEREAGIAAAPVSEATASGELIRRVNAAIRTLKSRERGAFAQAVQRATFRDGPEVAEIPRQTRALARLWWPLVLTTNYDDLYERAFAESFPVAPEEGVFAPQYGVVGRGPEDCQRVLNALSTAGRALIWALQGYLSRQPALEKLQEQLVIGHEQYRRVTHREPHFRRAFAEVFRQRSLLFLGSGISETYLQELFGEVLELFGPSTRPHYALLPADEAERLDPEFMLARFQITVASYPAGQHQWVPESLERLREEIEGVARKPVAWRWSTGAGALEVVRGPLPAAPPGAGHCLAVSAGGGDRFFFSPGIREVLKGWGVGAEQPEEPAGLPHIGRYPDRPVYAVRARSADDQKALPYVHEAASQLFREAGPRYRHIHMQLLAAGAVDKLNRDPDRRYDVRPFPPRFSLVQMVRAYADWRRDNPGPACRLVVHVVDPAVAREVASGRIDVTELLNCVDVRFWTEVVLDSGEIERRLFQELPEVPLDAIVRRINLAPEHWTVAVTPPPRLQEPENRPVADLLGRNLRELGVVPGSTLHFRRLPEVRGEASGGPEERAPA